MNGDEMRELRKRHKLTQAQLAEVLDVTRETVSAMENDRRAITDDDTAALLDLTGGTLAPSPSLDELPEPPYDAGDANVDDDDEGEQEVKPKRKRSSTPRAKRMSAWQQEASEKLIALTQGTFETIEINGETVTIPIPGLCAVVNRFDPYDAAVLYHGSPGLWVATVKVAPRHPWLKGIIDLLTIGGDYNELTRAVLAIAVPILMHHGMIPLPQMSAPQPTLVDPVEEAA